MEKGEGKDGHEPDEETGCMSGRLKEIHDDDEAHDGIDIDFKNMRNDAPKLHPFRI